MANVRLIARLDIKGPDLIKGVQLEGWRKVGRPAEFARRYYEEGADELLYMDVVASLYNRNNLTDIVAETAREIFIPLCVGGGVRSVEDADKLLRAGADKVAVNTAATKRPELISELSRRFGSQAVVLSIEAKGAGPGRWEARTDNGREATGLDVVAWARRGAELGAGEILVTAVDRDGTFRGLDLDLVAAVSAAVTIPVIAGGGFGAPEHLAEAVLKAGADAVAIARALHHQRTTLAQVRVRGLAQGLNLRRL
ncbi:MAG: imidazole glycerol phosphate synthase subunit HisF [Proteobacteria bacterium]|nr:imidazole glycerol phosphate synthase subunit HisF [Pseudomonadota bacterium]